MNSIVSAFGACSKPSKRLIPGVIRHIYISSSVRFGPSLRSFSAAGKQPEFGHQLAERWLAAVLAELDVCCLASAQLLS